MQIPILARFLSFWPQSTVSFVVPLAISEAPPLRILFGSLSLQFAGSIACWIPFLTTFVLWLNLAVVGMLLLPLKLGSFRKLLLSSPTSLSPVKLIALLHGLGSPHPRMFGQIACKATLTNVGSNGQEMRRHICTQVRAVQSRSGVAPRGREPRLKTGVSKHGPGQSLSERQLMHVGLGTIPPRNLQQACLRSCSFFGFEDEARQRAWGRCNTKDRLNQVLRQSQKDALNNWRHSVVSYQGACRWLRQKAPPPWTLECPNRLSTGRAAGAAHLQDTWEELFTGPAGYSPPIQTFFLGFDEWIPTLPPLRTDGWDASALLLLPEECWKRLLENFPLGRKLRLLAPGFVPLAHNIFTKGAISRFCWYPSFTSSSHFGLSSFV